MPDRRSFLISLGAAMAFPAVAFAQGAAPNADRIMRQLDVAPRKKIAPQDRVTVDQLKRRPEFRRIAPSVDIQSINFAFGSAEIPRREYPKVEQIGIALRRILSRRPNEVFLIEGHTDAVGSRASNQVLSERRALSLARVLIREFGIPRRALETVGYGEDFLLVNTQEEEWRNRRVTLRRITDIILR